LPWHAICCTTDEGWLDENEAAASPADFSQCIKPKSLTISACGRFNFLFDAANLFWGHGIEVRGTLAEGLSEAVICG